MEETQTWLDEKYLALVLKTTVEYTNNTENQVQKIQDLTERTKDTINDVKIVDYEVKKAIGEGKNYSSIIYKVQVCYQYKTGETKKTSFIIKKLIPYSLTLFGDKEIETFKMLPVLEQSIRCKISPQLYAYTQEEMIMEDLTELGFKNADLHFLDYDHCELAMKKLAKFHAGSVLLHRTNLKLVEGKIGTEMYLGTNIDSVVMIENVFKTVGDELATIPGCEEYAPVLIFAAKTFRKYIEDMSKTNRMRVLNHGDYWFNNLMFKYDAGKVCDVLFVDYQFCRYAPPTCDILYFIGSSADLDVRQNRVDELYSAYLEAFNDELSELGITPGMTKEQLYDNLKEDYHFLFVGFFGLLTLLAEGENYFSLDDVSGAGSEMIHNATNRFIGLVKTRQFRSFVPAVLDDLNEKGVLQRFKDS